MLLLMSGTLNPYTQTHASQRCCEQVIRASKKTACLRRIDSML